MDANSILVVGGGAAGVEMVGELRYEFPDKPIGILGRKKMLLPYHPRPAQSRIMNWAKEHKVKLHMDTDFSEEWAKENEYEFIIPCTGFTYASPFMQKNFSDCLSPKG